MMMVFRRWGHFYLALSNQALRKRTRERNQARNQVRFSVHLDPCEGVQAAKMDHDEERVETFCWCPLCCTFFV